METKQGYQSDWKEDIQTIALKWLESEEGKEWLSLELSAAWDAGYEDGRVDCEER